MIHILDELSIVNKTNESELVGSFSLEKSLITKIIIITKGARNADATATPIIRLEFNKDFLTNGSPQRPQIKIPSLLV